MDLISGVVLRDYRIVNLLGEGGMGEVFLAEETLLGRQVAIKRLNPSLTKDPQFSERFINEARIQARLAHPNIVGLYNFFIESDVYYMVMEYVEGKMLKDEIAITGPIPEQRSLSIFQQVISALAYAHAKGIIHRDIKPSNIMIDGNDNVKVMDFGIARLMSDKHLTRTGAKLGTLYYMSPEQVLAVKDIDHRTDIYSAGVVLYEMLTGRLPFNADTDSDFVVMKEITESTIPDPRGVYPHISDNTVAALHKATSKQRDTRYQDCDALYRDCSKSGATKDPAVSMNPTGTAVKEKQVSAQERPVATNAMVQVEGGTFKMGEANPNLMQKLFRANVLHEVTLSPFYISKYQLTQAEWQEVMGANPSYSRGADLPVERVSWYDAIEYCNKRSIKEGLTPCYSGGRDNTICDWNANGYRLPTEAEWEYAARGATNTPDYLYSGSDDINAVAWYDGNSRLNGSKPVGTKAPNSLGLYDMSGNVFEWCWDWYSISYYSVSPQNNPTGPTSGSYRVRRGGSWGTSAISCRVASRSYGNPYSSLYYIGFRLCRAVL